ncbi:hypothetical protein [Roseateles sp. P5_E8]
MEYEMATCCEKKNRMRLCLRRYAPTLVAGLLLLAGCSKAQQDVAAPASSPTPGAQPSSQAVSAATVPRLTEAEVKARYQNCSHGYYSGPRPGKARFTKDRFVWAVTPDFAAKYCMPKEFVSTDLKGAEAVAYRMVEDADEEVCGLKDSPDICARARFHQFEIYYRTGSIPKIREVPYFNPAKLPARMLISVTDKEWQHMLQSVNAKPRTGALSPFSDFGLLETSGNKVTWSLGSAYPNLYYEDAFEQLDYLSLQTIAGFSFAPGWQQAEKSALVIGAGKPTDKRRYSDRRVVDFALLITIPERIRAAVIANDKARGTNMSAPAGQANATPSTSNR